MKVGKIILTLLLLAAVGGGLLLVKQNQDVRKGAAAGVLNLLISPGTRITKKVGEKLSYVVSYSGPANSKVETVQTKVCYGPEIVFKSATGNTANGFKSEVLSKTLAANSAGLTCTFVTVVADDTATTCTTKLANAGQAMTLNFEAVRKGGPRAITLVEADTKGTIYVPGSAEKLLNGKIGGNGEYEIIDGASDCRPLWGIVNSEPDGDGTTEREVEKYCKEFSSCDNQITIIGQAYETKEECEAALNGDTPILNYKVSFAYVNATASECAENWPVQVIALHGETKKVYTNVIMKNKKIVGDKVTFEGSLPLVGFPYKKDVAVFFKGPKHLQMKYAVQNQTTSYGKAGGELVLTSDPATSIQYDFSGYPMLPGDLVGNDSDTPDGWINGRDFSYIKNHADHTTVKHGEYLHTDLNGDCQANSGDVNALKKSLEFKQDQLY